LESINGLISALSRGGLGVARGSLAAVEDDLDFDPAAVGGDYGLVIAALVNPYA
jgi:hypothetical protein